MLLRLGHVYPARATRLSRAFPTRRTRSTRNQSVILYDRWYNYACCGYHGLYYAPLRSIAFGWT